MVVRTGRGLFTANTRAFDVPLAIVAVAVQATVTVTLLAAVTLLAGTCAASWVALIYVVVSAVPFHCMVEVEGRFVPFTYRVKIPLPALPMFGESDVIAIAVLCDPVFVLPPPQPASRRDSIKR
jgi:hypothetical protein